MFSLSMNRKHGDTPDDYECYKRRQIEAGFSNEIPAFEMPPLGIKPKDFVEAHFGADSGAPNQMRFLKGTTTLAFCYEPATAEDRGGVIVAVDSRASGGDYIASKTVMKIIPINERMVATMAGGAADCQFWTRVVAKYCNLFELREKTPISVGAASRYYANVLYGYRNHGLAIGSMVAGVDANGGGPAVYLISSDGSRYRMPRVCSVGSGMLGAYGVLDTHYRPKMTDAEAVELGKRAIMHAVFRDVGSGGFVTVAHITMDGVKMYDPVDTSEMLQEMFAAKGQELGPKELVDE